jgi:hypothetical protein
MCLQFQYVQIIHPIHPDIRRHSARPPQTRSPSPPIRTASHPSPGSCPPPLIFAPFRKRKTSQVLSGFDDESGSGDMPGPKIKYDKYITEGTKMPWPRNGCSLAEGGCCPGHVQANPALHSTVPVPAPADSVPPHPKTGTSLRVHAASATSSAGTSSGHMECCAGGS